MPRIGPLIVRELREQCRRPLNQWLRVLGAVGLVVLTARSVATPISRVRGGTVWGSMGMTMASRAGEWDWGMRLVQQFEHRGAVLFGVMNFALLATIWLVAPLLTADCLSRERREGTLGLLFLTPLRAGDVVLAKLAAHGLRALGVYLGAVPVLVLPVLLGGVSWLDAVRAVLLDAGALLLALSLGLWASTRWQGPRAVVFGALTVSVGTAVMWACVWSVVWTLLRPGPVTLASRWLEVGPAVAARFQWLGVTARLWIADPGQLWLWRSNSGVRSVGELLPAVGLLVVAVGMAGVVFRSASRHVAMVQREGRPVGRGEVAVQWLGRTRFFGDFLEGMRRSVLRRQPVLWTELRTWRVRVGAWLMVLPMAPVLSWWLSSLWLGDLARNDAPLLALTLLTALAAASCLQAELQTGVLELLLTVPRGRRLLIAGKIAGLLLQLLPALGLTSVVALAVLPWIGVATHPPAVGPVEWVGTLGARVALTGLAGMYFSLRLRGVLPALGATLAIGGLAAGLGALARSWVAPDAEQVWRRVADVLTLPEVAVRLTGAGSEALLAAGFYFLLQRALCDRAFVSR